MLVVISKVMNSDGRIAKYVMYDTVANKTELKSPADVAKLAEVGFVIGVTKHGRSSVKPTHYFKDIEIIGSETENKATCYTVIRQIVNETGREYDICDRMGKVQRVSKENIIGMLKDGVKINGIQEKDGSFRVYGKIETILKNGGN